MTNQTLSGGEWLNYSRPGRVWFSDIPAMDGKIANLFYSVVGGGGIFVA
jgi:hypothetical protein